MKLKAGVKVDGVKTEILVAWMVALTIWESNGFELTVTSCRDGVHKLHSLHYKGWAIDIRTKDLPDLETKEKLVAQLKASLTNDYDVVFEDVGGNNEHVHLEYDVS